MKHKFKRIRCNHKIKNNRDVDVFVWGASRPDLLKRTLDSFKSHVKFKSGKFHFFLDDGLFDKVKSDESVRIAKEYGFEGIVQKKTGSYGYAMAETIGRYASSKYMFSLEDDWECLQEIDMDVLISCMEKNTSINQIRLNRRKNEGYEYFRDHPKYASYMEMHKIKLPMMITLKDGKNKKWPASVSTYWYFNPALWRTDFIVPNFKGFERNVHLLLNSSAGLLPRGQPPSPKWYLKNLGTITWGDVRHPAYFKHLGGGEKSIHAAQGYV